MGGARQKFKELKTRLFAMPLTDYAYGIIGVNL